MDAMRQYENKEFCVETIKPTLITQTTGPIYLLLFIIYLDNMFVN